VSELDTERLRLRRWRESDREPFAALNADPVVMEHFPALSSRAESDAMVDRIEAHFDRRGFGLWAVEVRGGAPFVGFVGLWTPMFEAHFTPAVEVGWRLAPAHWGHGYATEAARAVANWAFDMSAPELFAVMRPGNERAAKLARRLGMHWVGETDKYYDLRLNVYRLQPPDLIAPVGEL
jgi:RimJ/RimL family protein N-acetyltransferase